MIRILVLNSLKREIYRKFKKESLKVIVLMDGLKKNPNKGKVLGHVGHISIRELKYKSFRFYYIIDGNQLSLYNKDRLKDLLIKFVRLSKKNDQQNTIDEIKFILKQIGFDDI